MSTRRKFLQHASQIAALTAACRGNLLAFAPLYLWYGLSYTSFTYSDGQLSISAIQAGQPLNVSFQITNTGDLDGDEVAGVYVVPKDIAGAPQRSLVGFEKVHVARGERKSVRMRINPRQLSFVSEEGSRSIRGQPTKSSGLFLPFRILGTASIPK